MLRFGTAAALAALLAACGQGGAAAPAPAPDVPGSAAPQAPAADLAGTYRNAGPRTGELRITPAGTGWRLSLEGGSDPDAGAAAAGDCEVVAEGPLQNGRIAAAVVPFEGDSVSVTAEDLAADPATVTAVIQTDGVLVSTDFAGCGVGADLSGLYRREAAAAAPAGGDAVTSTAVPQPGSTVAELSRAFPEARLRVVEGYPWAAFALLGPDGGEQARLRFDGENADFADGSNTQSRVGEVVGWSALRIDLRLEAVEEPGTQQQAGDSGAPPA